MQPLKQKLFYLSNKGELAEWSNAAVLKTVEGHTSRGSNPLLSALVKSDFQMKIGLFLFNAFVLAETKLDFDLKNL